MDTKPLPEQKPGVTNTNEEQSQAAPIAVVSSMLPTTHSKNRFFVGGWKRFVAANLLAAIVSYALYLLAGIASGLAGLYIGPFVGMLTGAAILFFIGKLPLSTSILVPLPSLFLLISILGFGLPSQDNQLGSYIPPILFVIFSYIVNALVFTYAQRFKLLKYALFIGLLMFYEGVRIAIFRSRWVNEQSSSLSEINFDTYIPTNLPKDYKIHFVKAESDPFWSFTLPSVTINLKSVEENDEFDLQEFPFRKNFKPPIDCGSSQPFTQEDEYATPCVLIGHSSAGCEVYREEDGNSKSTYAINNNYNKGLDTAQIAEKFFTPSFCRIKDTILTLGLRPRLTNEEIIKLYDSLKPITHENLKQYID